eukprot:CAMPEP_0181213856 /NCGR_PEP_ID=MMETSP1096-20121128/25134_1 /TAXON_ID=156174 ORGANISM="Chrysochromulina ericina, Strain CCMP281" /NCGR_SAMPLE_ID=MMETSP1096 /ASSEMBLY_ACC=CAM_ASM_000453 /LENGTH=87 /DNA_ID=CAMNT_0023305535 /DNA_START=147 /DNA_END=406 /DNA_ORIENTATION=-
MALWHVTMGACCMHTCDGHVPSRQRTERMPPCLHSMPPRHRPDLSCRDSDMHISNGGAVVSASSTAISNRQSDPTNLAHPPHPPKTA